MTKRASSTYLLLALIMLVLPLGFWLNNSAAPEIATAKPLLHDKYSFEGNGELAWLVITPSQLHPGEYFCEWNRLLIADEFKQVKWYLNFRGRLSGNSIDLGIITTNKALGDYRATLTLKKGAVNLVVSQKGRIKSNEDYTPVDSLALMSKVSAFRQNGARAREQHAILNEPSAEEKAEIEAINEQTQIAGSFARKLFQADNLAQRISKANSEMEQNSYLMKDLVSKLDVPSEPGVKVQLCRQTDTLPRLTRSIYEEMHHSVLEFTNDILPAFLHIDEEIKTCGEDVEKARKNCQAMTDAKHLLMPQVPHIKAAIPTLEETFKRESSKQDKLQQQTATWCPKNVE